MTFLFLHSGSLQALQEASHGSEEGAAEAVAHEAAHGEEHHESPLSIMWKWANFLILFGGLAYYLRKPMSDFLETRAKAIQQGLAQGREAREEAARKMNEIESRLSRVDQDIQQLKSDAQREAEEERARILESARVEAEKILEMARREVEGLQKSARLELKAHVADLAIKLAEERLRKSVGPEENKRLIAQFLDGLNATKN